MIAWLFSLAARVRQAAHDLFWALLRQALLALGTWLFVKRGALTGAQLDQIVGLALMALPVIWAAIVRWDTRTVPAATAARADVPTVSPVTGAKQT